MWHIWPMDIQSLQGVQAMAGEPEAPGQSCSIRLVDALRTQRRHLGLTPRRFPGLDGGQHLQQPSMMISLGQTTSQSLAATSRNQQEPAGNPGYPWISMDIPDSAAVSTC